MNFDFINKLTKRGRTLAAWCIVALIAVALNVYAGAFCFVEINDGGTVHNYTTGAKDVETFLKEEGITIYEGDVVEAPERLTTFSKINITRSFDVELIAGGESRTVRATPGTVSEILSKNGITIDEDDIVNPGKNEYISEYAVLSVDFIEVKTEIEDIVIPSVTHYLRDTYDVGTQEGSDGLKRATYEVRYVNGEETERTLLDEHVVLEAVDSVVVVGTHTPDYNGARSGKITSRGSVVRYKQVIDVVATAYTHTGYRTASMTYPKVGTVAVDPRVIPLGSKLYIESADGESWIYGYAVAEDTGGLIKGGRIDLFMETEEECICFGVRDARVYVLE